MRNGISAWLALPARKHLTQCPPVLTLALPLIQAVSNRKEGPSYIGAVETAEHKLLPVRTRGRNWSALHRKWLHIPSAWKGPCGGVWGSDVCDCHYDNWLFILKHTLTLSYICRTSSERKQKNVAISTVSWSDLNLILWAQNFSIKIFFLVHFHPSLLPIKKMGGGRASFQLAMLPACWNSYSPERLVLLILRSCISFCSLTHGHLSAFGSLPKLLQTLM